jgi:hypothetical protein
VGADEATNEESTDEVVLMNMDMDIPVTMLGRHLGSEAAADEWRAGRAHRERMQRAQYCACAPDLETRVARLEGAVRTILRNGHNGGKHARR